MESTVNERTEFLTLFLRHEGDLRAFIGSAVRDRHAAEDVLQEVAVTAWERFDDFDPGRSFGAWTRGIAVNKVLRRREQNARFPAPLSPETLATVADAFDRSPARPPNWTEWDACLERLPRRARELLTLRYGASLEIRAIAERLRSTPEAIYKALQRARHWLRDCVANRQAATED